MKRKMLLAGLLALTLTGCGYSGYDIETVGQVKKIVNNNPIICNGYIDVDLSLGVMRNGVGSMSNQDIWINITAEQAVLLKKAMETGKLVKIVYDSKRFVFCTDSDKFAKSVELVD